MLEGIAKFYYNKEKILLIEISSEPRGNEYLSSLYSKYYNIYKIRNFGFDELSRLNFKILLIIFNIVKKLFFLNYNLITYESFRKKIIKLNKKRETYQYNEVTNNIEIQEDNFWVDRILKKKLNHQFNDIIKSRCENFLVKQGVNLKNKNVNFFFRERQTYLDEKNILGFGYFDILRNKYKKENYIPSIKWFHKKGYNVFIHGAGEFFNKKKFPNIFFVNQFDQKINTKMLNIYLHYFSYICITQNSGSVTLASALKKKIIVTNMFPFCTGIPGKMKMLFPKVKINHKIYKINELINSNYFYGRGFEKENVKILPNTSSEILEVLKDKKKIKIKKIKFPNDCSLKFRKDNLIYY